MATVPQDKAADFTASDLLAADTWTGRAPRPALGLDVACTKIAVDLQNIRRENADECIRGSLELLREATASDCAFALTFGADSLKIADMQVARAGFAPCRLEELLGESLDAYPWLKSRLEHLRLSELRDTGTPRREQQVEARRFAELAIGSALLVAFRIQGKPAGVIGLAQSLPRGA
ncbi:MAG TPA: hypothetical protein VJ011_03140, partial [Steroidobacteraceae bacterium]|nr:hypothetical protein [Steroidobacteraceae bacterium]